MCVHVESRAQGLGLIGIRMRSQNRLSKCRAELLYPTLRKRRATHATGLPLLLSPIPHLLQKSPNHLEQTLRVHGESAEGKKGKAEVICMSGRVALDVFGFFP